MKRERLASDLSMGASAKSQILDAAARCVAVACLIAAICPCTRSGVAGLLELTLPHSMITAFAFTGRTRTYAAFRD
jgi:hypothetical protein